MPHLQGQSQHGLRPFKKGVESLPRLEETLCPFEGNDEVVVNELWTFVQRKSNDRWVWLAFSRASLQVLAFAVGRRDLSCAQELWKKVPSPWNQRMVFTDAYPVYDRLFASKPLQHCVGRKREGLTSVVEGANNALRQRVSYLGRKSAAFARSTQWLETRMHWFIHHWNQRQAKKYYALTRD